LDLGEVPSEVAMVISNMARKALHSEEFSCVGIARDGQFALTIACPMALVSNHLYEVKSTVFQYDPEGFLTNTTAPGYVNAVRQRWGGDVFLATNGPWVRCGNANVFQWRSVEIHYFYKDERPGHPPRLIPVYFPMDDATWTRICAFLDGAKIQQVYEGRAYPIGVDDIRTLGLWQTGIDDVYALHTHRDEHVKIDLRKKTYSVQVFGPR